MTSPINIDKGDLTLEAEDGFFNFRVGCLLFDGNKILLEQTSKSNGGYWFTPGGRVRFQENTKQAVIREMKEELHLDIDARTLNFAGLIENFFEMGDKEFHEIAVFYRIPLPENFTIPSIDHDGHPRTFDWHNIEELNEINLLPSCLKDKLAHLKTGILQHSHTDNVSSQKNEA